MDETFGEKRFEAAYQLNKDELSRVFDKAYARHASKARLIVQTVLMAAVAVISLIDYITVQPRRTMSLVIAVAAAVVGVAQWVIMPLFRRSSVKQQLAENETIHLAIYENGIGFGEGARQMIFDYENCRLIALDGMLIVRIHQEYIGVPDRVIGDDRRLLLSEKIPPVQ
ncbi:MAG: hypothetical protein ACOYJY_05605 [Acutalibacteraceae bacterium]|jgi:hypothetical protein